MRAQRVNTIAATTVNFEKFGNSTTFMQRVQLTRLVDRSVSPRVFTTMKILEITRIHCCLHGGSGALPKKKQKTNLSNIVLERGNQYEIGSVFFEWIWRLRGVVPIPLVPALRGRVP